MRLFLKKIAEGFPYFPGKLASHIPFSVRLGRVYGEFSRLIDCFQHASSKERLDYSLLRLNNIVRHAQKNIPFYRKLYGNNKKEITSINDFEQLPIITRSQVRKYVKEASGSMLLNTGGSTDGPLSFYIDNSAWAREWAHMHYIWDLRGYKKTDLIMTMMGKPLGERPFKYNAVHNEFLLNPYISAENYVSAFLLLLKKYPIKYFQGYPSTIYNFFREIEPLISSTDKNIIAKRIRSCFFSSEYPMPYMIDYLRNVWGICSYISWYGHSEMCVLAYDEFSNGEYSPFITYGYAEEVNGMLLGTSFHNYDMPLIRYATEDLVDAEKGENGLIERFRITKGRSGDFIEDANGRMHALTFFLGRHHEIYNIADFVQVYQPQKGKVTYYITCKRDEHFSKRALAEYFCFPDIEIEFDYILLKDPIRTQRGKLKLKLSEEDILKNLQDKAAQ